MKNLIALTMSNVDLARAKDNGLTLYIFFGNNIAVRHMWLLNYKASSIVFSRLLVVAMSNIGYKGHEVCPTYYKNKYLSQQSNFSIFGNNIIDFIRNNPWWRLEHLNGASKRLIVEKVIYSKIMSIRSYSRIL